MKTAEFDCGCWFPLDDQGKIIFQPQIGILNLECPKTWNLICSGDTLGIFQLESRLGKSMSKKVLPRSIEELADQISIVRPGVLEAMEHGKSMTQHYIDRKHGLSPVEYFHPALEPIVKKTYGIMVYQEQAMQIAKDIAGFTLQEADSMRKAIGKKLPEEMAKVKTLFLTKAKELGIVTDEQADKIWEWIEKSQRYSFNKCVSGDTVIRRPTNGKHKCCLTVREMFNIRNDINYAKQTGHLSLYKKWKLRENYGMGLSLNKDGRIRKNHIIDINYAGRQHVFRLETENGSFIDVTEHHKFPTPQGEKTLGQLKVGDEIYICGEYQQSNFKKINSFSDWSIDDIRNSTRQHDGKTEGFLCGQNNPGYTNGAYSEFCKTLKELPNYCEKCGATNCRLEAHHIDGNRTNNLRSNLVRLCSSCHKTEQYKLGRVKFGEKGYPHLLSKILEISYLKETDTYDVTMDAPNHNFVVSTNIVTSNSHAVAYAMDGYISAYAKYHFPKEFFTSYLAYSKEEQNPTEVVEELVANAKRNGIEVWPPDIRKRNLNFKLYEDGIYCGISNVKSVGKAMLSSLESLISGQEARFGKPIDKWTWTEFLLNIAVLIKKDALANLIQSGALSYLKTSRRRMLYEVEKVLELSDRDTEWLGKMQGDTLLGKLKNLAVAPVGKGKPLPSKKNLTKVLGIIQALENPPYSMEDTAVSISEGERQTIGISLTCSKIDDCDQSSANCTCKEFLDGKAGYVLIACCLDEARDHIIKTGSKRGEHMGMMRVSDSTCQIENCVAFPEAWALIKDTAIEGNTVMLGGQRDKKNKDTLVVSKIWQL